MDMTERAATIWKYPLTGQTTVHAMPKGAKALHLGTDPAGDICAWFLVDPEQDMEPRGLVVVGTGNSLPMNAAQYYLGTFVIGEFVNHVFVPPIIEDTKQ
jgi:hypothetical protein